MPPTPATHVHDYVARRFPKLGLNKRRETARLLFEISKRDGLPLESILPHGEFHQYRDIKSFLVKKRFPNSHTKAALGNYYLPQLDVNPDNAVRLNRPVFAPRIIYVEDAVSDASLVRKFGAAFPQAAITPIPRLKEFLKGKPFAIADYNRRTEALFIVRQITDYFEPCPCTKKAVHCGYNIMNLGLGCPFECTYCYLQEYQDVPGIVIPANIEDFFKTFDPKKLKRGVFGGVRVGTGEFTDSLVLDHITGFSSTLIDFFRQFPEVFFEFKTKSVNIGNILTSAPAPNVVVSWSLNPQKIIDSEEAMTAPLDDRLKAARTLTEAGHRVGFHFDPIIDTEGWEKDYAETVEALFSHVDPQHIAWISLGTLRFAPPLKKIIENRFPRSALLDEELLLDFDGKMRYEKSRREYLLEKMLGWIRNHAPSVPVYPCMEEGPAWTRCGPFPSK
ncbi:MAG: hypothetical protein LHV69_02730 [Elusimicrobia bacterium]|nr:hypothetical protein [Candidatus Obscuribacterium magneticum]